MRKIAMFIILVLAACGSQEPDSSIIPGRWYTQAQIDVGRSLYQQHCAVCHGADGSATADWRSPGADGHYPPPPLNGSAHSWHHPLAQLESTIQYGGTRFGGAMPAFAPALDRRQRLSIVAYIQAWWAEDIYVKWAQIDARSP